MWVSLLRMLGKGGPSAGASSFTALALYGASGPVQRFATKTQAGQNLSSLFFMRFLARIG